MAQSEAEEFLYSSPNAAEQIGILARAGQTALGLWAPAW